MKKKWIGVLYNDTPIRTKLLLKMKLITFLLFLSVASMASSSYSQQTKFTMNFENITVQEVLQKIEDNSEFIFLYSEETVDLNKKVNVSVADQNVNSILDQAFIGTNYYYEINDRQITILSKPNEESDKSQSLDVNPSEQNTKKIIKGKITDSDGITLPGVSVIVKGTTIGTTTDIDGNYTLEVPNDAAILQFSFVGMEPKEVPIDGQSTINVTLAQSNIGLEEVVAVGYGTQKKSDVIASVASVNEENLVKVVSSDLGEMLRGKATGVYITTNDASPGSETNIMIRGQRSLTAGNSPLILVDGVQVSNINDVNPNDIQSMEILKDAAAQAIYGARASNGVILIATKRGKSGKAQVSYTGYYGLQTVQKHFETYTPEEFIAYKREAFRADGGIDGTFLPDDQVFSPAELQSIADQEYIDWEGYLLQLAPISEHTVSVSGGSEQTKVFSSISYLSQEGVVKGTDYDRGTVRLNVDHTINDWLKVGINSSFQISQKDNPGTAALVRSITTSPLGQVYNEDGSLKLHPGDVNDSTNPLLDLGEMTNDNEQTRNIVNVFLDLSPFEGFNYRFSASRNATNSTTKIFNSSKSSVGISAGGLASGSVFTSKTGTWQLENIVNYSKMFDEKHDLGVTLVQSYLKRTYFNFGVTSSGIPSDNIGIYYMAAAASNTPSISATERSLLSYTARVQYSYGGKYYVSGSIRADGSSVFGANNKWGYFPAVALGWNVNRENFLIDNNVINILKLRASYGSVGNEGISPYGTLNTLNDNDYLIGGTKAPGLLPGSTLPNPDLKWETTTSFNLATDFGVFQNRLNGTLEYYDTRTKDLLVTRGISGVTGYTRKIVNLGEIQNTGFEFSINGDIVRKNDLTVNAGFMFNRNRNKIIHLFGEDLDGDGIEDDVVSNKWFIGQPVQVFYDYKMLGIFSTQEQIDNSNTTYAEPGDVHVQDVVEDGELTVDDKVVTSKNPDWYGTFTFDVNYKGFDLTATLYTVQGIIRDNNFLTDYDTGGNLRGYLSGIKQDYWTPEHTSGTRPRPLQSAGRQFLDAPDEVAGLQDASFVRLQTLTFGYSLPQSILSKLGINRLRVYVTGQNLFTLTDFEAWSPEQEATAYPETVSVIGGIQLGF